MGTLALNCPFCCNETFTSHNSLKYHILSLIDNLRCPACDHRFDDIHELAEHLGRECRNPDLKPAISPSKLTKVKSEASTSADVTQEHGDEMGMLNPKMEVESDGSERSSILAKALMNAEENTENPEEEEVQESSEALYLCQMCNVHFNSIEEHLAKFHDGEEVLLETEDGENQENVTLTLTDADEIENDEPEEDFDSEEFEEEEEDEEAGELHKKQNTVTEQAVLDKEGRVYTRKVVKIDKFWIKTPEDEAKPKPLLEKYVIDNGKIRKITKKEAETLDKSSVIEIHQCPRCCMQFPNYDNYDIHKCDPSKVKEKYKCAYCTALFLNVKSLQTHMKAHIKESGETEVFEKKTITLGPFLCEICQTKFPSFKSLRLHSRMHDPIQVKQADAPVSYTLSGDSEPKKAVREMFVCKICNKTYDVQYKEVHMKSHSEGNCHICSVCNKKFFTQENLEMHMKAHSNVKKFVCSYCKKPFLTFEALTEHIANQCQKRQYECQYCGRRFSRPHEKVKHERIHTGEKPHICEICGKSFRVSYCLTLHMRTHSGTRPYQCNHCGKRFKSHSVYNHHLLTHSEVRAYKCPFCPKAFKTSVQLAGHKNSHTKPFNCKECNRPFASLYAVRAHMETHKRDNNLKYDCWLCGASYARAFALRDHMKAQHEETILGGLENEVAESDSEVAESTSQIEQELASTEMEIEEATVAVAE